MKSQVTIVHTRCKHRVLRQWPVLGALASLGLCVKSTFVTWGWRVAVELLFAKAGYSWENEVMVASILHGRPWNTVLY
jgi:hypothetical protein